MNSVLIWICFFIINFPSSAGLSLNWIDVYFKKWVWRAPYALSPKASTNPAQVHVLSSTKCNYPDPLEFCKEATLCVLNLSEQSALLNIIPLNTSVSLSFFEWFAKEKILQTFSD